MRFPSIKTLTESAGKTIQRFPFELLFALAGTIAATTNIELNNINRVGENWCLRIMIVANLGLLLSLSATLFAESRAMKRSKKLLLHCIAAIVALSLLFLINPGIRQADYVRFFLLSLALHLLVAFAAFTRGQHLQGFWQFNKTLFLRFLTSALYGLVLFLGISAAIQAINYLFNFKFEWDTFSILFTWIVGIFSTTFFLAGVPGDIASLDQDTSYPKGLKVFTQYVLIPLASVYVLILLAYEVKILLELNLPKGAVSYLILSYAVFGILALLLVYPIRGHDENKWLKTYARSFYFLLIPLLVLLFIAVGVRFSHYGITEFRYFLIALACWLFFITAYFLLSKKQNIRIIPISLCIVTLLSVYGPQSAFTVSMYSQRHILINIFKRNKAYKDGQLLPVKIISKKDGDRAADVLDYLVKHHDLISLQPYFRVDLTAVSDSLSGQRDTWNKDFTIGNYELRETKLKWARSYLGLSKFSGYYGSAYTDSLADNSSVNYYFQGQDEITNIKGYNYLTPIAEFENDANFKVYNGRNFKQTTIQNKTYAFKVNNEQASFDVNTFAKKLIAEKKGFEINKSNNNNYGPVTEKYFAPVDSLTITRQTLHYTIKLSISDISFSQSKKWQYRYIFRNRLLSC